MAFLPKRTQVCIFLCVISWFFQENIAVSGEKIM